MKINCLVFIENMTKGSLDQEVGTIQGMVLKCKVDIRQINITYIYDGGYQVDNMHNNIYAKTHCLGIKSYL